MLDRIFCNFLEYKICNILQNLTDTAVNSFWCDGVQLIEPEIFYSQKFVNDNKQVTLKSFVGKDGQEEYELILKFGPQALSRYARNLDIRHCVPNADYENWFRIDTKNRKIEMQLG